MRNDSEREPAQAPPPKGLERVQEEARVLGQRVREARRREGLSQEDVAFAANVSPRTVFAIEQGKATVRLDMLARVLAAVGLRLSVEPRDRMWIPLYRDW